MNEFQKYLRNRIAELSRTHADLRKSERAAPSEQLALSYNSQAAVIWDVKTELEITLGRYNCFDADRQAQSIDTSIHIMD